jgi:hypothetical protein
MSIRQTQFPPGVKREPTGYEGPDIPTDFVVPSCTLEDADRSVFDLFNEQLPLQYVFNGEPKRIPVIFATGERFAVLNRKEPLRDKNKTLILPLISIMRTGLNQHPDNGHGPGQMHPSKLKIRISPESDTYKRLLNKIGLQNQDNIASTSHREEESDVGVLPGTVGSRRKHVSPSLEVLEGKLLKPDLADNIYEIITMPPVKYYQATYNITIWSQFTKQMNEILSVIMSTYQNNYGRTFRLETKKGYWFVGYVGTDFSTGENFDDFTDSERIVKQSFDIKVNAYLIMPDYPGSPNGLRRSISAPNIEFKAAGITEQLVENLNANVPSSSPSAYILDEMSTKGDGLPGQAIGVNNSSSNLTRIGESEPHSSIIADANNSREISVIGGHSGAENDIIFYKYEVDPFTGKRKKIAVRARKIRTGFENSQNRQGESVYREGIIIDLGDV